MWLMKTVVIPVVVGALGTCKEWDGGKRKESITSSHCDRYSKDCKLGSAQILRKVLSV